jgi:ATP phosphoribosyltransferase
LKNPIAEAKRQLAKQLRDAANGILNTKGVTPEETERKVEELNKNATLQISAIIGKLEAGILEGTADILDYLSASDTMKPEMQRRQQQMEDFDAIRTAASVASARGNWAEYDKLVRDLEERLIAAAESRRKPSDGSGAEAGQGAQG